MYMDKSFNMNKTFNCLAAILSTIAGFILFFSPVIGLVAFWIYNVAYGLAVPESLRWLTSLSIPPVSTLISASIGGSLLGLALMHFNLDHTTWLENSQ